MNEEFLDPTDDDGTGRQGTVEKTRVSPLSVVYRDVDKFLTDEAQVAYIESLLERLEDFGDRTKTCDLQIRKHGKFWELEATGFVLHKICCGICFAPLANERAIVVLGVEQKDHIGQQLKTHQVIKMERRLSSIPG
jgi:hypothetical protein